MSAGFLVGRLAGLHSSYEIIFGQWPSFFQFNEILDIVFLDIRA